MSEALKNEVQVDPQTGEIFGWTNAAGVFCGPTYERSESIVHLAGAMVRCQAAMRPALKTSANPYFKSKYSDLATVWEVAQAPLSENGLAVFQPISTTADGKSIQVTTLLVHTSGEWISSISAWPARPEVPKDKFGNAIPGAEPRIGPQGLGSAATYGRRYSLSGLLNIVSEDDDGERAEGRSADAKSASAEPAKPPRRTQAAPVKPPEPGRPAPPAASAEPPPPEPPVNVTQFPSATPPSAPANAADTQRADLLRQISDQMLVHMGGDKGTAAKVALMKQLFGKEKWSAVCVLPIPQLLTGLTLLQGGAQ